MPVNGIKAEQVNFALKEASETYLNSAKAPFLLFLPLPLTPKSLNSTPSKFLYFSGYQFSNHLHVQKNLVCIYLY